MKTIPIVIIFALLLSACNKNEDFTIPGGCIGQNFFYTSPFSVSTSEIDFSTDHELAITCGFSKPVTWKVTLEGSISKAKKVYTGNSNIIDIKWTGNPGDSKFFVSNDVVNISLSVPCSEIKEKSVRLIKEKDFSKSGILLSDFDGKGYMQNSFLFAGYNSYGWSSYFTPSYGTLTSFQAASSPLTAPQGNTYMTVKGKAADSSWFIGGVYTYAPESFIGHSKNNTYFNAMISSGNNSTTTLDITLLGGGGKKYNYVLPITWKGWKLISISLLDFKDENGSAIANINEMIGFDFALLCASGPGQEVELNMDMVMLSKNEPLTK